MATSKQVLNQILEPLASAPVGRHDAAILAFQMLAWAYLSSKNALAPSDELSVALEQGHNAIVSVLSNLEVRQDIIGLAFENSANVARRADTQALASAKIAKGLIDAGVVDRFSPADIGADLVQWMPGYESVPPELARLVADLAFAPAADSVYCPWEFSGQFIGALLPNKPSRVHVEGPHRFPLPGLMALFHTPNTITVEVTDPLRLPAAVVGGELERFDATIACLPFGMRPDTDVAARDLYARFPVPKATATGLMIQHIVAQTRGHAAIVVPNSFLFGVGTDREVRERLLRAGQVQAVIALPGGSFFSSNVPVAILVLNMGNDCKSVRFLDATGDHFRASAARGRSGLINGADILEFCRSTGERGRLGSDLAVDIPIAQVLENDAQLQVNRYVMSEERRRFQENLAARPSVEIGQIATLIASLPNKDRDGSEGDSAIPVREVGAADLPFTGYIRSASKELRIRQGKTSRTGGPDDVFLRPYDVVLINKGSTGKIGIVPPGVPSPGPGGWIAGQSAVVLRARPGDLRALAVFLRHDNGQKLLASITSGATIPMISLTALKSLQVPILDAETEARAIQALDRQVELQREIDELIIEQSELIDSLWGDFFED